MDGIVGPDSDSDTDEDMWQEENEEDPYSEERLAQEQEAAKRDPLYLFPAVYGLESSD